MSKGNSGILSKHQAKLSYSGTGTIGDVKGYEVLKELTVRVRNANVNNDHKVVVEGRMATDDAYEEVGVVQGQTSKVFYIADFDYIRFTCVLYSSAITASLRTSGFFNNGRFTTEAIETMNNDLKEQLIEINSTVCNIQESLDIINRQIELITDHEEDEVK